MGNATDKIIAAFARTRQWFREALFPVFCLRCGKEGKYLCDECFQKRPELPIQRCVFCGVVSARGETCSSCAKHHALAQVAVRGVYKEWVWRDLIRTWKYRGARELDEQVQGCLTEALPLIETKNSRDVIVIPVPLARERSITRGFNQATLLSVAVARTLGVSAKRIVARTRDTQPQSKVEADQRQANVQGAFQCLDEEIVRGKICLLVDDIVTTGATLNEIAIALRAAGAASVCAIALTRSDIGD